MYKYIETFPEQLIDAISIGEQFTCKPEHDIHHVVVCGMGGSGIGGDLLAEITRSFITIPVVVNKQYELPAFVNENTLVILSSYSGNTEETISAYHQALKKNAQIACITTGGKLLEVARNHILLLIQLPGNMPPRTCVGYSLIAELFVLIKAGLIAGGIINDFHSAIRLIKLQQKEIKLQAEQLALQLGGCIPVIYISTEMRSVAIRWKQQFNENAKIFAVANELPEMNHNELEGYAQKNDKLFVIFLRNTTDHARIKLRFDLTKNAIAQKIAGLAEVSSMGSSFIEQAIYLIHFGDWLSFYAAKNNNIDPIQIDMLDALKTELGKTIND